MTCLEKYKLSHPDCYEKELKGVMEVYCPSEFNIAAAPEWCRAPDACEKCWQRQLSDTEPAESESASTHDPVNHPKHYCREGGMESIDEMLLVFGKEATMHFCLLNAWKYRYRAAEKNGAEDIAKSDWYIAKYAELKGGD